MNIAILTFEGFNELDSFIALGILNRMKGEGWNVQVTCPTAEVTSMNGVTIQAQQPLEFAVANHGPHRHPGGPCGDRSLQRPE